VINALVLRQDTIQCPVPSGILREDD